MATREESFRQQARSDLDAFQLLLQSSLPICHALHYLQMATEKAARGIRLAGDQAGADQRSHVALVKALRLIANSRNAATVLAGGDRHRLRAVVLRLLPLAEQIEQLAPAVERGGAENAEYPWRSGETWIAPAAFHFENLSRQVRGPDCSRLIGLLRDVMDSTESIFGS